MSVPDPLFAVNSLSFAYGRTHALEEISLKVSPGALGLLGPNGAGKTTLIKLLMGFLKPGAGTLQVLGLPLPDERLKVRLRIGWMPESDCHIPGLNAVEYVSYAGRLCGMEPVDALQRAHEVLYYVGLGEARYRKVETYSQGMKQRIKLAQAIIHDPQLLLLDEPTNGLDPAGREEMLDLVRDIGQRKEVSVLLSSHLLPDVEHVCEEVVVLNKGRVALQGSIGDLKKSIGRRFDLRLRGTQERFIADLNRQGAEIRELGSGRLRVIIPETMNTKVILKAAAENEVELRHMKELRQTLEEVFIEALQESGAAEA
ncbi:ATP-binding cassette domain-containing protein [Acidobacteriota bacterium]